MSAVTSPTRTVHVKAVPVNGLYQFVERELSNEQLRSVLAKMKPEDVKFFTGHVLATEQVPLDAVNTFTALAAQAKGEPVKSFGRRAGRFGADLGLKSVYKFIMMVLSIDYVLRKAPFMWTRVYDGGNIVVEQGEGVAKVRLTDFPSAEAGCARIGGWFEVIAERAGARDLKLVHNTCMAEGGSECLWTITYRK
jgi:hypothetical protein